jgi:hypothetical protein
MEYSTASPFPGLCNSKVSGACATAVPKIKHWFYACIIDSYGATAP